MTEGSKGKTTFVGIAGGSGAGKSTLAGALRNRLGEGTAAILDHDAYYRNLPEVSLEERSARNFDAPEALETELFVAHLDRLASGQGIDVPIYDFEQHLRATRTRRLEPFPILLVEGILVLSDEQLRSRFNVSVFVDADSDVRLLRRLERDLNERGRDFASVARQYRETVKPMHEEHVETSRAYADLIVPGDGDIGRAVDVIASYLEEIKAATENTEKDKEQQATEGTEV